MFLLAVSKSHSCHSQLFAMVGNYSTIMMTMMMIILLSYSNSVTDAFMHSAVALRHAPSRKFSSLQQHQRLRRHTTSRKVQFRMDIEGIENSHLILPSERENIFQRGAFECNQSSSSNSLPTQHNDYNCIDRAQAAFGMPWRTPIDKQQHILEEESQDGEKDGTPYFSSTIDNHENENATLLYMPFWEWQMDFMKEKLTNLRVLPCTCHQGQEDFTYQENTQKQARMFNLHLASDEYRKIRMTYYDAGDKTQVFNSLWYPSADYNLPVLGIDLIQFNRKKHLVVVDFQPIHQEEHHHTTKYEHLLESIRQSYPSLQGKMSKKFYDETQFFSRQMLFSRFETKTEETTTVEASSSSDSNDVVSSELMPAFQQYVQTYLELLQQTPKTPVLAPKVLERQQAYDTYSAERDPAARMFEAMFGKEWADKFMYEFLFSMSEPRPTEQ